MAKKIFDISLPKEREEKKIKGFSLKKKPEFKLSPFKVRLKKSLILIPLVLIIAGILAYFTLSQAEIEIWPETEMATFETKLTVDEKVKNINLISNLIPGISFQEEKTFSQEFAATGKKLIEETAEGVIRVYNNYHSPQTLIKYTRFQPPLEKILYFCTKETVVVPAKSERDVKVFACKEGGKYLPAPGEEYNIKPSTFAVPGLAGSAQYTFVYGKSFQPMTGGLKKETSEVTQEDLQKAQDLLKEKATKEIEDILKTKIPPDFITLEGAVKTEILETFSLAQVGAELEKFTFQVKARAKIISFKKEDLENFSKEFIISKIPTDKKLNQKSLKINYLPETINLEAGEIALSLNLEAKIYSEIAETSLKQGLAGKSLAEAQLLLQNQPEIKLTKVKLWPFWVKKVPQELEKIKLKIHID